MDKEFFVIRHRAPIIAACLLLAGIMGFQLRKLEINADFLFMFSPTMQSRVNTEKIEKIFGSNDMLFVLLETQDVLDQATLVRVKNIGQELKKVPGIKNVISLFDTKDIRGENGSMIVEPAVTAIPTTDVERRALR
ncbi:MAG: MprA protease, GlyGly-CTERM protein-sorting domain-containing form, partial [Candidatus Raymondbacteria bacterium RifOxyB12_full_50_8]